MMMETTEMEENVCMLGFTGILYMISTNNLINQVHILFQRKYRARVCFECVWNTLYVYVVIYNFLHIHFLVCYN